MRRPISGVRWSPTSTPGSQMTLLAPTPPMGWNSWNSFATTITEAQALETAALMLGTDKSRGYCLEMICADFLAGANLDNGDPNVLLRALSRFFQFLPGDQRQAFAQLVTEKIQ